MMVTTLSLIRSRVLLHTLFSVFLFFVTISGPAQEYNSLVFAGTYTDGKPAAGIYVYSMDTTTGELRLTGTGTGLTNPSFLTLSVNRRFLYACTDTKTLVDGSVTAFAIDSLQGTIRFINKQSSRGANPVYVSVHNNNRLLVAANYTGGSMAAFAIAADGSLGLAIQSLAFTDSGINKARQDQSHIHSAIFSNDYRFLYLPDLGADKLRVFAVDTAGEKPLVADDKLTVLTAAGSGPRHMVFHPMMPVAYCIEEMSGYISVYQYANGALQPLQRLPSYSKDSSSHSGADIHVSPDGRFLYSSNRGENTIAVFAVAAHGRLRAIGHHSTLGDVPRNFAIAASGNFLLVANQGSNNIVVFRINRKTGFLHDTGYRAELPSPSCVIVR